ncbi:MAG: hypothetical protein NXH99_27645, partial [Rhodobacteraceae bacterium]|nr:hypothetical protein [Paracoccaceae bacterium]
SRWVLLAVIETIPIRRNVRFDKSGNHIMPAVHIPAKYLIGWTKYGCVCGSSRERFQRRHAQAQPKD